MRNILVIAPHADDELLGCGGTILRHLTEGDRVHWLIVTTMTEAAGYEPQAIQARRQLIREVSQAVGFHSTHPLEFPATLLDTLPISTLVSAIGEVVDQTAADTLYLPYEHDVHTDHGVVFNAAKGCCKWFRHAQVKRVYVYETMSESDFAMAPQGPGIQINRYVDISDHLQGKLDLLGLYHSETAPFPFPRSLEAIEALARVRGAACGCHAAEAFQVIREIV